jgi:hypothetical protein
MGIPTKSTQREMLIWDHMVYREFDLAADPIAQRQLAFRNEVMMKCKFRAFPKIGRGCLGVGPYRSPPGDKICSVNGSDLPVLLRKVDGH